MDFAGRVRYTDHIVGDGEHLFKELEKRKLEGMVAKRSKVFTWEYEGERRELIARAQISVT